MPALRPRPSIRRYDAEILSHGHIEGTGFRVELESQNVAGHCDFDVQYPQHVLTLTLDGPPTRVVGGIDGHPSETFSVRAGQLTLLPMGQRFRGYTDGLGTRGEVKLMFEPELVAHVGGTDIDPSRLQLVRSSAVRNPVILQAMAALGHEVGRPDRLGRLYAESLVMVTVTELLRHHSTLTAPAEGAEDLTARRLRRAVDYIETHLGEDLSLLTLATDAGMSPAHLSRGFKLAMGRSVHQYLLRRRVDWAAALLRTTERSIAEIALTTGFGSQSHLTTAFQRLSSTTPAAYRRQPR